MSTRQPMFVIALFACVAARSPAQTSVDPGGRLFRSHLTALTAAVDSPAPRPRVAVRRRAAVDTGQTLEIYGFAQADMIYDFGQSDPNWFDANRPTQAAGVRGSVSASDNRFCASVRQSRFGAKGTLPTGLGPVKAQFEFDMFGVGVDAGQTTIRLRHAYGQLGQFGAGQTRESVHGRRRVPEHRRVLGTERHDVLPQRAGVLAAGESRQHASSRSRSSGPARAATPASTPIASSCRTSVARFPAPDVSGGMPLGGKWGYVEARGHRALDPLG